MNKLVVTPIKYSIHRENDSQIFGDNAIHLTVTNDGAGNIYVIENVNPTDATEENFGNGKISLDKEELGKIVEVISRIESN